jgi:NAD(P) transhydrogenase subunit alpha
MVIAASLLIGLAVAADSDFLQRITVFVLACFIGYQVVWNVTPALHTPLMSVTNAISGIILVGGILQAGTGLFDGPAVKPAAVLGMIAILVASINIVGGFLVTQRMLGMFRREG